MLPRLAVLALFLATCAPAAPAAVAPVEDQRDPVADSVLAWANRVRADSGAPPLARDARLDRAAAEYSRELAGRGELSHLSSDPRRGTAVERMAAAGARYARWAENLGATGAGRNSVGWLMVNGWLFSPQHRGALLDPGFLHAGTGAAQAADGTWYVVQLYGAGPLRRQ